MSKNEWLKRAEKRKQIKSKAQTVRERAAEIKKAVPDATVIINCCTRDHIQVQDPVMAENAVKFKGKFQEADKVNKQGRMYSSKVLEESIKKIAAEGAVPLPGQDDPLHERWQPPTQDEDVCIPIRPKSENEFVDLSAAKVSNSRYKEYDRLRLMQDAMTVYNVGRSEPRDIKLMDISVVSSGGYPAGPTGPVGPQGPQGLPGADNLGEADDVAYFKNKMLNALKMPKEVSKKLASVDVHFARQYERETGESLSEWRELSAKEVMKKAQEQKLEELKIHVMANNPQILGVPADAICVGPQGSQGFDAQQMTISSYQQGTPIRFTPEQISHHVIGNDRRVFSVDVPPQDSEKFIEKLKAAFKKKAMEDKRWQNIEAQAAESETWFSPNGPNRGQIPNIIDVFADVAAEAYVQVSAKIDQICNESFTITTPMPEAALGGSVTINAPATLMADSMIGGNYNINIGGC